MARAIRLGLPAIGVLLAACLMAWAAETEKAPDDAAKAAEVFQSLYGDDLQRVAATRDTAGDIALAARLLEAAKAAGAAEYLDAACDPALRKYVPAAAKGVEAAPELACVELGDWYRDLAAAATTGSKVSTLTRAQAYYARYLALHAAAGMDRTKAELALTKVEEELDRLRGRPGAGEAVRHCRVWPGGMATGCPPQRTLLRDRASFSRRRYGDEQ